MVRFGRFVQSGITSAVAVVLLTGIAALPAHAAALTSAQKAISIAANP
jgi:hypothetical protein